MYAVRIILIAKTVIAIRQQAVRAVQLLGHELQIPRH